MASDKRWEALPNFGMRTHRRKSNVNASRLQLAVLYLCQVNVSYSIGINYGMVADNLPLPTEVVRIMQSISVTKAKIYSANSSVLRAFGNTGISFIVGIGNEELASLTDLQTASRWVEQNILLYLPNTKISAIAVGNEVYSGNNTELMSDLLPAMKNLHSSLVSMGLNGQISVSTPHSLAVLANSYPPSAGMFNPDLAVYMKPFLLFLTETAAPFMINAYPYFAYKASPSTVSLDYALFRASEGVSDVYTGLIYYNMLDAQVDAIYSAISNLGFNDIKVIVSETGWPSKGDFNEAGASLQNAQAYNANLIRRITSNQGTPLRQNFALEAYLFALFNEDEKPGPTSERNYGLFRPDGTKAYDFGLEYPTSSTLYIVSGYPGSSPHVYISSLLVILCAVILKEIYKHDVCLNQV